MGALTFVQTIKSTAAQNLTTLGGLDWRNWTGFSDSSANRKTGGVGISNLSGVGTHTNDGTNGVTITASDPTVSTTQALLVNGANGTTGFGKSFTLDADTSTKKAYFVLLQYSGALKIDVSLSDSSASPITYTYSASGFYTGEALLIELDYSANSAGQTALVSFVMDTNLDFGRVCIQAVALSSAGLSSITGSTNKTLAALTATANTSLAISGSANKTLSALTTSGSASLSVSGATNKTLAGLTTTSAVSVRINASANKTLAALTTSGSANLSIAATTNKTLAALTSAAAASTSISGTTGVTLAALTATGVANLADGTISAFFNKTLAALTTTSAANVQNTAAEGTLNKTLAALTSSSNASISISGAGLNTLAPLVTSAQAQMMISSGLTYTLQPLTSNGAIGELIT